MARQSGTHRRWGGAEGFQGGRKSAMARRAGNKKGAHSRGECAPGFDAIGGCRPIGSSRLLSLDPGAETDIRVVGAEAGHFGDALEEAVGREKAIPDSLPSIDALKTALAGVAPSQGLAQLDKLRLLLLTSLVLIASPLRSTTRSHA